MILNKDAIQEMLNRAFAEGQDAGRVKHLNPVKEAVIARLEMRIEELERQAKIIGRENPAWEAGYQRALYIMPDEIARAWAGIDKDPSFDQLKVLYDIVGGIMRGHIDA